MNNLKLNYFTKPLDMYVNVFKSENMLRAKTDIQCPLCKVPYPKRNIEDHIYKEHAHRYDEAFAQLFGGKVKCACGKDLHYNRTLRAFPKMCTACASQHSPISETGNKFEYKNVEDARLHIKALKAQIAVAQAEEIRLKKEAELEKVPIEQLPFPAKKYNTFMRKLSQSIRIATVEGDRNKVMEVLNFIDSHFK